MKKYIFFSLIALIGCCLISANCFALTQPDIKEETGVQRFGSVYFRNDFPGARLNMIRQINDSTFSVVIEPENTPTNKSGWYAFKTWSERKSDIIISLEYAYGEHRYTPKVSNDGKHWKTLSNTNDETSTYRFTISPDTLWVAAQELLTSNHVWNWIDSLASTSDLIKKEVIGKSIEGRPIVATRIGALHPKPVLVVLSRQHPPEVTGQLAMKTFLEEMAGNSEQNKLFLQHYSIIAIPLINPDGVEHGHWRNNLGGVDLNRDWSEFQQPETRCIKQYLERQVESGDSIVFALDFHSTKKDVFYIVTDDEQSLTSQWLKSLHKALPGAKIDKSFHGNQSDTSKNWIYKRFGAEAVTYEVGDETDRGFLKQLGSTAAKCLQTELLNRHVAETESK